MTEITQHATVMVPVTGEVLDLSTAGTAELAEVRDDALDYERQLRTFKHQLDEELHRRMDFEGSLTLRDGPWEIKGKAPTTTQWDVTKLRATLEDLVRAGHFSARAAEKLLRPEVVLKPQAGKLNTIMRTMPGPVRDALEACREEVPQERRASVKRS